MRTIIVLGGALGLGGTSALAQATPSGIPNAVPVPFEIGEALTYDVKFGAIKVGTGRMRVLGIETIRDRLAWHIRFSINGGTFFYKVNDLYESWMDVTTLNSLRFVQDLEEGSRDRERHYEIFPDRAVYQEHHKTDSEDRPSVAEPLDDGSFLYFIRTVNLEVGQTFMFNRYFRPDRNPVLIRVLRRERIRVPAGEFNTIVIQPVIKTSGIFSEGGQAEIWLSDDEKRIVVQMKSRLSFGSLNLYLRAYRFNASATGTSDDAERW